jgi:hypothetical protein
MLTALDRHDSCEDLSSHPIGPQRFALLGPFSRLRVWRSAELHAEPQPAQPAALSVLCIAA